MVRERPEVERMSTENLQEKGREVQKSKRRRT